MSVRESGELLQVQGEAIEEPCHMFEDYPVSSFTPLDCPRPISQYINPNDALHYPISYDESIYDIPGDISQDKPAKNAKKRTSTAAKKRRIIFLGNVWQYTNEGDVGCEPQGYDNHENAPRRRKSLPAKQSKASKAPFKTQVIKDDDARDAAPQEEDCQEGRQESQLITLPDTGKGDRKRGTILKKKKEKLPVFKNLTITKSVAPPGKELEREEPSSVLSYQGWTATQDAVKFNHVGLAKTTLDKLAAFKYRPSTQSQSSNTSMAFTDDAWQPPEDQSLTSRSDAYNTCSRNDFFRQPLWNIEANDLFTNKECPVSSPLANIVETSNMPYEMARVDGESIYDASKRMEMHTPIPHDLQRFTSGQRDVQDQVFDSEAVGYSMQEPASDTLEDAYAFTGSSEVPADLLDDDFDDDLDDADFLAIAFEADLPKDINQNMDMRPKSPPLPKNSSFETGICNTPKGRDEELPSSLVLVSSDSDTYPMETSEEEGMLELCQSCESVVERFHATASIQHAFEDMNDGREVYDSSLQFSPPNSKLSTTSSHMDMSLPAVNSANHGEMPNLELGSKSGLIQIEEEDWSFMATTNRCHPNSQESQKPSTLASTSKLRITDCLRDEHNRVNASLPTDFLDDSHEYEPLDRFARPEFPELVRDRCPIVGVSSQTFLRVCFRVGEMFREGSRCRAASQDGVIELFARVTFSSREGGTTKQHFQFADLWSENPPFPTGILLNYKVSDLTESESKVFIGSGKDLMARCLGRLKKERKSNTGWVFYILNIRETDWEEIRWTKRVVSAGTSRENKGLSKLGR